MEHAAKASLINGLAAVIAVVYCFNGYYWAFVINAICCVMMCFYWNTSFLRQVMAISQFLGAVFGIGLTMAWSSKSFTTLGLYMMYFAEFHFLEFHAIAICNPSTLSSGSFVLAVWTFQSGVVISIVEYLLEYIIYPDMKGFSLFSLVGLMLLVGGELIRKGAMITAGVNYTHEIACKKTHNHSLVTTGLYGWVRHPAYVGSFYGCIGAQLLLCNPIGLVYVAVVTWRFFKQRIHDEEEMLITFYCQQYMEYKKRVGSGLLGIYGYPIRKD